MSNGIDLSRLHEIERVSLRLPHPTLPTSVAHALQSLGFELCDDFCFLRRTDTPERHQTGTVTTAHFYSGEAEVSYYFDDDSDLEPQCDTIVFDYLLASLPMRFIADFLSVVHRAQSLLGGSVEHRDTTADMTGLERAFADYVSDIQEELAEEPGSEFLSRIIHESYPRTHNA